MAEKSQVHGKSAEEKASLCFSLGLCIAAFGILSGKSFFWEPDFLTILPSGRYAFLPAIALWSAALFYCKGKIRTLRIDQEAFGCGLVFVFLSDWLCRLESRK